MPKEMSLGRLKRKQNYTTSRMGLKQMGMEWICLAQDSDN